MKKMISAVLAAAVFFSSIQFSGIQVQAAEVQEEKKDISECTFVESIGERPYKVPYHDTFKEGTIRILESQRYTGNAVEPKITIKDGDYTLVEGTDYSVFYTDTRKDDMSSPVEPYCGSFLNEYGNEEGPVVDILGKGNYAGSEFFCYAILSKDQKETEDHLIYSDKAVLAGYDGVTIDGYVGAETEVEIPLYLDGKPVQEINEGAFEYNPTLEKVNVSDNVYRILGGAFFRCRNLKEVNLSRQLWGIGSGAFAGCTSLKEVNLPASLEKVGNGVFQGSSALEAIHSESEAIYDIDGVLFRKYGGIAHNVDELYFFPPSKRGENYCIPDGTQWIEAFSFRQAEYVKNVIIPQSVGFITQGSSSAFGGGAQIEAESKEEISTNAINIIFKHDVPNVNILDYRLPFSYRLPAGTTITVKNEEMKEAAEASVTEEFLGDVTVQIAPKASQGFELVKNAFTLSKGEEDQLRWMQTPVDTTENITWASSDESVVKVDPVLGKMKAEGYGECIITGTDESGHKQEATVQVKQTEEPGGPTEPGKPEEPGKPTDPTDPGKPEEPGNPGNPEGPGNQETKKQEQQLQYKRSIQKAYGNKPFSLGVKRKKGNGALSYNSSNKKVIAVSSKGVATIKGTGRATITVTAKETAKYRKKTVKITVDITPKKQSASVKAVKGKKLSVKWKKDARATGYQIQYSTDRKFKKGVKKAAIKKKGTASKTIPKLKKRKTYYVRVRAYKSIKVSGKTKLLYGAWSKTAKSKKIK